jgi:hypothetical protein
MEMTSRFPHAASRRLGGFQFAGFSLAASSGARGPHRRCEEPALSPRVSEKINRKLDLLEILQLIENKGTCQKSIGNFPDSALHKAALPATIESGALPLLPGSTCFGELPFFCQQPVRALRANVFCHIFSRDRQSRKLWTLNES